MVEVGPVRAPSPDVAEAVRRLVPQLTRFPGPYGEEDVAGVLADPASTLLTARDEGRVVGLAVVVVYRKLTRLTARLEDVVVDESARGRGVGAALVAAAVDEARRRAAKDLELSSGRWREAANRLYPRAGMRLRDTNVWWMEL